MGTSLIPISTHKLDMADLDKTAKYVVEVLKSLNLSLIKNSGGTFENSHGIYHCIDKNIEYTDEVRRIEISGPAWIQPVIYEKCLELGGIYRYWIIEKDIEWINDFRREIYSIVREFGGSEVIYLADNNHHLVEFSDNMLYEGIGYNEITKALIEKYGNLVTDFNYFKQADFNTVYLFLDNFNDL
jgi:hypothetical protein